MVSRPLFVLAQDQLIGPTGVIVTQWSGVIDDGYDSYVTVMKMK